jgi:parvulin-like peptidyl-prolyl isomerase
MNQNLNQPSPIEQLEQLQDSLGKRFNFAAETQMKPVQDMTIAFQAYINATNQIITLLKTENQQLNEKLNPQTKKER